MNRNTLGPFTRLELTVEKSTPLFEGRAVYEE